MSLFSEQAGQFATTREDRDRLLVNVMQSVDDIRVSAVKLAAQEIADGHTAAALDVMRDCYTQQFVELQAAGFVRHLEAVPA